ncbi:MAG: hypothetical protein JXN61_14600 [Sedimentisphaerales bacterium]|nr:hypothetical protein [Sedimentisphaerales bacterium]
MTLQQRLLRRVSVVILLTVGVHSGKGVEVPDPSIMLPLVPAAAQAGAPPVIKPGTRLTYFGMTASIPGEYGKLVQDDKGNWIDKNTGKRYREEDIGSSGSAAYNVVQVGHVADGVAELSNKVYLLDTATKRCSFASGSGLVGHAGCAADYWIHPDVLKQVQEVNAQGVRILRMPYTVGGKLYNAIRFQSEDTSGYQARVYDLETGLLIFHASRVQGPSVATPPIGGSNKVGIGEGSTQIVTGWIVEVKDIDVPWKAAPPLWVAQFGQLSYRGVQTSVVAAAGTRLDRAMTATLTPKARGPGWLRFTNRFVIETYAGMPPEQAVQEGACGSAAIGGLWISPKALANLRPQQVIETNNIVGTTVAVSQVGPGSVTISEAGPLHRIDWTYDRRTGILSAMTLAQQIGLAQLTHSIQLAGQQ